LQAFFGLFILAVFEKIQAQIINKNNMENTTKNVAINTSAKPVQNVPANVLKNAPTNASKNPQELHDEFVRLGGFRFKLKNKMLLILPDIYASGIWKKYAGSIVEYAGRYGDIAKTSVIKRLRLEENLVDKPCLRATIGKVGIHKVAMVAKITTPETDSAMAENVLNMSKVAIQILSKELRMENSQSQNNQNLELQLSQNPQEPSESPKLQNPLCNAVPTIKKIELDEESTFLFLKLKAKT
jgi:hypothetical protein